MRKLVHEVTAEDLGKNYFEGDKCSCCGRGGEKVFVSDLCGRFLKCDEGKRIYSVDGVLQMENDAQLRARLARGKK